MFQLDSMVPSIRLKPSQAISLKFYGVTERIHNSVDSGLIEADRKNKWINSDTKLSLACCRIDDSVNNNVLINSVVSMKLSERKIRLLSSAICARIIYGSFDEKNFINISRKLNAMLFTNFQGSNIKLKILLHTRLYAHCK